MGQYKNETQTSRINSKLGAKMFTMNCPRLDFSIKSYFLSEYNQFFYKAISLIFIGTINRSDHCIVD